MEQATVRAAPVRPAETPLRGGGVVVVARSVGARTADGRRRLATSSRDGASGVEEKEEDEERGKGSCGGSTRVWLELSVATISSASISSIDLRSWRPHDQSLHVQNHQTPVRDEFLYIHLRHGPSPAAAVAARKLTSKALQNVWVSCAAVGRPSTGLSHGPVHYAYNHRVPCGAHAREHATGCNMKWWKRRVAPAQTTAVEGDGSGLYKTTVTKPAQPWYLHMLTLPACCSFSYSHHLLGNFVYLTEEH